MTDSITVDTVPFRQAAPISDIIICDEIPYDGVASFDLTTRNDEIMENLPSSNFTISYHLSQDEAFSDLNQIIGAYENTEPSETIYVRIESMDGSCLQIGTFNVQIGEQPNFINIPPIVLCAQFLIDGVGYLELAYYAFEIANYEFNRTVTFHTSEEDAIDDINDITYASEMPFGSTFTYVRIENDFTGCISIVPTQIIIQDRLDFNQRFYIDLCLPSNQAYATFNLGVIRNRVLEVYPNANISFYTIYQNAQDEAFPIFPGFTYENEEPYEQTVYMSVTDENQDCPTVVEIDLHTNLTSNLLGGQPVINRCDDSSNDGVLDFDLIDVSNEIKNGYDVEVNFFHTPQDRQNSTNAIPVDVPFRVENGEKMVYITVASENCESFADLMLKVNPSPNVPPLEMDYCGNSNLDEGFITIQLIPLIAHMSSLYPDSEIKFYVNENDAIADENTLITSLDTTNDSPILFVRLTNNTTGCYDITRLQLNISNDLVIATPDPIIVCNVHPDPNVVVNLESVLPQLSNELTDFEVSFHEKL